jgi:homogentisate phytyltransferase/homogentisate geranylgeranyltransferase
VTTLPRIAWRLLRFRVAAMVWTFMLLGAAAADGLPDASLDLMLAAVALAASYVAATAANDLADEAVDRINHPGDRARPLVTGQASRRDLRLLHPVACLVALAAAAAIGGHATALVAASLVVGVVYSLPPARLSYQTWLAPLVLAVAYVIVPYGLGAAAVERPLRSEDAVLVAALFALFLSRIVLKDYRDRPGDLAHGKPTLLLRFGSGATCAVSLVALVVGGVVLIGALRPHPLVAAAIAVLLGGSALFLRRLYGATSPRDEQVAIGLGARLGNGVLLIALAWLVLGGAAATETARVTFVVLLTSAFAASTAALASRPERVVIGYKG